MSFSCFCDKIINNWRNPNHKDIYIHFSAIPPGTMRERDSDLGFHIFLCFIMLLFAGTISLMVMLVLTMLRVI